MRHAIACLALLCPLAALAASPAGSGERPFSHTLKPGGIAEECLRLEAGKSRSFHWAADGPVDFNIHYHRGKDVSYPVKLNGQTEGRGKFTAQAGEDYCWMWTAKRPTQLTGSLGPEE